MHFDVSGEPQETRETGMLEHHGSLVRSSWALANAREASERANHLQRIQVRRVSLKPPVSFEDMKGFLMMWVGQ
ncbi:hypothetical protein P167DRAFT_580707 [Morchella conica CCBAS932]|uniref:Uncharacterized protein n=1 Tax=Morchella conica CCBAS932 TaxID=1392247 RepID=A0A3N4K6Y5_9PEZI|nr:hypothetical protein P167DRAFT_580707 [Morchella conica CCBAS932]